MASRVDAVTITAMSDTHELHREIDPLPGGDLLIHAGDFSMFSRSWKAIEDFALWFAEQPYTHKIVTFGNHEFAFEADPARHSVFTREGIVVLVDAGIEIAGLRVWGSPTTPLYGGAFGLASAAARRKHWSSVPGDTDILITHGPPLGILDQAQDGGGQLGDGELLKRVLIGEDAVSPWVHIFGHVHGSFGIVEREGTTFMNTALLGIGGALERQPVSLRIPRLG